MSRDVNPMVGHCRYANIIHDEIVKEFGVPDSVIELGCGRGGNLHKFIETSACIGVDPNPDNIQAARDLPGMMILSNTDHSVLHNHEYNQFDVGYTCSVLDHMENFTEALSELCRVCKRLMLFEPVIEGESRQARPDETSCWTISWYHDLAAWLKKQPDITFKDTPYVLYKNDSGKKFHQFIINCEKYDIKPLIYSKIFDTLKGRTTQQKQSICEIHKEMYDLMIMNLQDQPLLLTKLVHLLETAFGQGVSIVHKLLEYKLTTNKKIKENIPMTTPEARKLREERIKLVEAKKELGEVKQFLGKKAEYV